MNKTDDKIAKELIKKIQSFRHKFYFNKCDELRIENKYRIKFDKDTLIDYINNSIDLNAEDFLIDFILIASKHKYVGKIKFNFGKKIDEHNEKELYLYRNVEFDDNCPYNVRIVEAYINHDDLLSEDSYIELYVIPKKDTNDYDSNMYLKEDIIKIIDERIEELEKEK